VRLAYATAGLPAPRRIVWCQSPFKIVKQLAAASPGDLIGRNVKADVFDHVRVRVGMFAEVFWNEVLARQRNSRTTQRSARRPMGTTRAGP
jgi:hypothetical protein